MARNHRLGSKAPILTAITLIGIVSMIAGSSSCSRGGLSRQGESITIGTPPLESSALIYVAEDQRFFAVNGLDVAIRDYETGAASLNGLVNREVDIATPAEYALIGKAFNKDKVRAIASIDKVQYFYIIGRKDRGIEKVSDLNGKKIGVVEKTTAEFYLGRFLALNGLGIEQVALVNTNYPQSEDVLVNGFKNPAEAKAIVQKRLNLDDDYMATVWSQNQFALTLDQSLVAAMEDEARWMIQNNLTTEKTVPDFLAYVYEDGLKAVKPAAVNVSR